jgi:hypothetical protein
MAKRGRPRDDCGPYNLKALCKIETLECIRTLKEVRDDKGAPPAARVKASEAILDRGWGKPTQTVEMEVTDNRAPGELTRDELAERAAAILAGDGQGNPGGISRPN